jgi:hypothetical protein
MYAQRFGSLPIGHRTGGLAETIVDGETGFLFERPSSDRFLGGLCRAFSAYGMKEQLDRMRPQRNATEPDMRVISTSRAAMGQAPHFGQRSNNLLNRSVRSNPGCPPNKATAIAGTTFLMCARGSASARRISSTKWLCGGHA